MTQALFSFFALVLLLSALGVVSTKNPVQAALLLILSFFTAAMLWMLMKAEFLAVSLVLIYVGAVMVLFLFVVMMLDINFEELRKGFWKFAPIAGLVAGTMLLEMVLVITHGASQLNGAAIVDHPASYSNVHELGRLIYTQYFLPFQLASFILLVGMIAAIALTLRKRKSSKYINPGDQVRVKASDRLRIVKMATTVKELAEVPASDDKPAA
jgi:NADH-quinone oxidoreductase subunit J